MTPHKFQPFIAHTIYETANGNFVVQADKGMSRVTDCVLRNAIRQAFNVLGAMQRGTVSGPKVIDGVEYDY